MALVDDVIITRLMVVILSAHARMPVVPRMVGWMVFSSKLPVWPGRGDAIWITQEIPFKAFKKASSVVTSSTITVSRPSRYGWMGERP